MLEQNFESALAAIASGYDEGVYEGLRHGVTGRKSCDGKRTSRFACARGRRLVSFNLYRLKSGEDSLRPCEMPTIRSSRLFWGMPPIHRGFKQGCVVSCDACVAARRSGRRAQFASRCSGKSSPSQATAVNAAATASAAAVHITCRCASTTVTDARADADVLPNAHPSAATATRPPSRAAVLFIPSQRDSFYLASVSESGRPLRALQGRAARIPQGARRQQAPLREPQGNMQYISVGNAGANERAALMLMNYPNRRRLKIYARGIERVEGRRRSGPAPRVAWLQSQSRARGLAPD